MWNACVLVGRGEECGSANKVTPTWLRVGSKM